MLWTSGSLSMFHPFSLPYFTQLRNNFVRHGWAKVFICVRPSLLRHGMSDYHSESRAIVSGLEPGIRRRWG